MKKPCKECPFKRDSLPGYLGEVSYQPEQFLAQLEGSTALPCHLSVDYSEQEPDYSESTECVGALQYMNNSAKLSRSGEVVTLQRQVGKNPLVFQWRTEFIEHHK